MFYHTARAATTCNAYSAATTASNYNYVHFSHTRWYSKRF
jgi:hypothetical protein